MSTVCMQKLYLLWNRLLCLKLPFLSPLHSFRPKPVQASGGRVQLWKVLSGPLSCGLPPPPGHLPTAHSLRRVSIGSCGIRAGQSLHTVLWDRWDGGDILSP